MSPRHWMLLTLLLVPGVSAAQGDRSAWTVTAGLDHLRFSVAARDAAAGSAEAVHLRPTSRAGARVAIGRGHGPWRVELGIGWAVGHVEAANEAVAISDRTLDLSRYRLAFGVERAVARAGSGELALAAGPTLDLWSLDGENRTRAGLECALTLRLPLGGALLDHRVGVGVSGSPLESVDLDQNFALRSLWALSLGLGLRVPF